MGGRASARWRQWGIATALVVMGATQAATGQEGPGSLNANGAVQLPSSPADPSPIPSKDVPDETAPARSTPVEMTSGGNAETPAPAGNPPAEGESASGVSTPSETGTVAAPRLLDRLDVWDGDAAQAAETRPLGARGENDDGESQGRGASIGGLETGELVRVGGALALVLVLAVIVQFVVRRLGNPMTGGSRPSGIVEVLARYPVGRGQSLVLIRLARRVLLVHQASGAMTTLSEISDRDEVAGVLSRLESGSRVRDAVRFRRALEAFDADHDHEDARDEVPGQAMRRRDGEIEIIDLTKRAGSRWSSLLKRRTA